MKLPESPSAASLAKSPSNPKFPTGSRKGSLSGTKLLEEDVVSPVFTSRRRDTVQALPNTQAAAAYFRDERLQDKLFCVIVDALHALFGVDCLEKEAEVVLQAYEAMLTEHYLNPTASRLRRRIPEIGTFFTPLPFLQAFRIYNEKYRITRRRFVPPTFHEIRHIMNIAQIMAVRKNLKMVSFDGDETLYPDGKNFEDEDTASYITTLLRKGVTVAVVTAAGYAYQTEKYEARLKGLLEFFARNRLAPEQVRNFFLFGGESNYLLRCADNYHLEPVPEEDWRRHLSSVLKVFFQPDNSAHSSFADHEGATLTRAGSLPGASEVERLLDVAETALRETCEELGLRAMVVRKERAVGLVPGGRRGRRLQPRGSGMSSLKPEILEETVYRVRKAIRDNQIHVPFCAFNGGRDVWVDVGNKAEGLMILHSFLGIKPAECLHIGDQFSESGNDLAARNAVPTLWIVNPNETKAVLRSLLRQMNYSHVFPDGEFQLQPSDCVMDLDEGGYSTTQHELEEEDEDDEQDEERTKSNS